MVMKYLLPLALVGVCAIRASDLPYEHVQRRSTQDAVAPREYVRYPSPQHSEESPLADDLPFPYLRATRSSQPEGFELGEVPFEYVHPEESELGDGPFEHIRPARSLQPEGFALGEGPFEYVHPEESELGEGPFEHIRPARSLQPEGFELGEGPFEHVRPARSLQPEALGEGPFEYLEATAEESAPSRVRRSWQGAAPQFPVPGSKPGGNAGVDISRQGPNTHATVNAQHGTDRYEVGGQWSKVVRGPNKAKPEWNVHGAIKW